MGLGANWAQNGPENAGKCRKRKKGPRV